MIKTITKADMVKVIWPCIAENEKTVNTLARKYKYNTLKELWVDARKKIKYGVA